MLQLPIEFKLQIEKILGEESSDFFKVLNEEHPSSIRYNPSKEKPKFESDRKAISWARNGEYLHPRPKFTYDPYFHAGHYYVQDASSMILEQLYIQTMADKPSPVILDLCAAPGGKATHLLSLMQGDGMLIANEVNSSRVKVLHENLVKWGYPNFIITQNDPSVFSKPGEIFDLILIDAPCSGEGLFRKDKRAIGEWSPSHVQHCSFRQKRITAEAVKSLKPGGYLIYSTCTYNSSENEQIVRWLEEECKLERASLDLDNIPGLIQNDGVYKCFPHRIQGEGFSIALLRKKDAEIEKKKRNKIQASIRLVPKSLIKQLDTFVQGSRQDLFIYHHEMIQLFPEAFQQLLSLVKNELRVKDFGISIGHFKGNQFIPAHGLSQSRFIKHHFPSIQLNRDLSLQYLRGQSLEGSETIRGWHEIRFNEARLGWVKAVPKRMNNNYPKNLRIRN